MDRFPDQGRAGVRGPDVHGAVSDLAGASGGGEVPAEDRPEPLRAVRAASADGRRRQADHQGKHHPGRRGQDHVPSCPADLNDPGTGGVRRGAIRRPHLHLRARGGASGLRCEHRRAVRAGALLSGGLRGDAGGLELQQQVFPAGRAAGKRPDDLLRNPFGAGSGDSGANGRVTEPEGHGGRSVVRRGVVCVSSVREHGDLPHRQHRGDEPRAV